MKEALAILTLASQHSTSSALPRRRGTFPFIGNAVSRVPAFLACVVLAAFAIRLTVVACLLGHVSSPTINYNDFGWESWEMGWTARSIFLGQGFSSPFLPVTGPTALVPPLYPYILAGIFHLFGLNTVKVTFAVLGFNSLCSALTCIPLYFLALNALNRRAARIAAIGWAVYPFAVYFSADRVWDYALTGLLFSCCLLAAQRLDRKGALAWAGFGTVYALAALSNPSIVSLLPVLLAIAIWKRWRAARPWVARTLLALVTFAAVCTPWTVRNHRVMHSDFFIRDGFWLEFYAGNNGDTHESNSAWAHPASNPVEMAKYRREGEIAYMAEKRALSLDYVRRHPKFFAVATVRRIVRFWTGYWSFNPQYLKYEPFDLPNVPFCLFLVAFTVRGLRRWWKEDREGVLPYVAALLVFPLPYYLTHSSMDYRQPIEPIMIVLVTLGLFGTHSRRVEAALPAAPALEEVALENPQPEAVLV